ncbi:hypothetical protein [Paraburkholderia atlantica]
MNLESIEMLLDADRALYIARVASGCGMLALLVIGRIVGLL